MKQSQGGCDKLPLGIIWEVYTAEVMEGQGVENDWEVPGKGVQAEEGVYAKFKGRLGEMQVMGINYIPVLRMVSSLL